MEKKRLTGRDILRMDGLLPPTRRLPVCDAVSSTSEKKKDKKWSIDGILKRFSLIRDYESSSNDEEIVYCKREPKKSIDPTKKKSCVVLRPVRSRADRQKERENPTTISERILESNVCQSAESLSVNRDSVHSRSSDGSLDGLSRRVRRNKVKARVEAQRDRLCPDSSSDEDSRKSSNSLTRGQNDDSSQSSLKSTSGNKKTRTARTERYIKRLSRDDGNGSGDVIIHDTNNRKTVTNHESHREHTAFAETNGSYRPPIHPRRTGYQASNSASPLRRPFVESGRDPELGIPDSSDYAGHSLCQYITDFNQNDAYEKTYVDTNKGHYGRIRQISHSTSPTPKSNNYVNHPKICESPVGPTKNLSNDSSTIPLRNAIRRPVGYECHSYPFNPKHHRIVNRQDSAGRKFDDYMNSYGSYGSNNEITRCGAARESRRPMSLNSGLTQLYSSQECLNNKYAASSRRRIDSNLGAKLSHDSLEEIEATKCRRRNTRNEQLNSNAFRGTVRNKLTPNCDENTRISSCSLNGSTELQSARFTPERSPTIELSNKSSEKYARNDKMGEKESEIESKTAEEEAAERKRNSKNLEEALSELEAIYNSLRLGDEDLLDRAERRSMEEFSMKQSKRESEWASIKDHDSPDRTKDDMAYRRMHPKERPASLSEIMEQSSLPNISYLIASPVLTRKEVYDEFACIPCRSPRRDEPDVTRDDVVFRSINRANNTLKVLDPQPPFGIPLGPVTGATESDYLHTTPRKSDQPRSPYIPQAEPDIVTDDLAFRALRKDANTSKKIDENGTEVSGKSNKTQGPKKKRAVRSFSANLYGLINHDSIELHKQSNLKNISSELIYSPCDTKMATHANHFRRVVSDGELSDHDLHWHVGKTKGDVDINGNHSCQKKLRVYVSPITKIQSSENDRKNDVDVRVGASVDAQLMTNNSKAHWDLRSDYSDTTNDKNVDPDFTEYSRLCQDLVDSIRAPDEMESTQIDQSGKYIGKIVCDERSLSALSVSRNSSKDVDDDVDKQNHSTVLRIASLGRHYASSDDVGTQNKTTKVTESNDLDEALNFDLDSGVTDGEEDKLDYYLRLADENVKLIAEAFSNVVDHIQDSEVGNRKTSSTSLLSETDYDVTTHEMETKELQDSHDEEKEKKEIVTTNTDTKSELPKVEISEPDAKNQSTILKGDQPIVQADGFKDDLDLSQAVHDLEMAAASLRESVKRTEEELEAAHFAKSTVDVVTAKESSASEDKNDSNTTTRDGDSRSEESTLLTKPKAREGESTECEFDNKMFGTDPIGSAGSQAPHVTNIIAITITTYSMVLLACFLALLLAIVAAS